MNVSMLCHHTHYKSHTHTLILLIPTSLFLEAAEEEVEAAEGELSNAMSLTKISY